MNRYSVQGSKAELEIQKEFEQGLPKAADGLTLCDNINVGRDGYMREQQFAPCGSLMDCGIIR